MIFIALLYVLNTILMISIALYEAKRPVWAVPWLVTSAVLPIIGPFAYFLLSKPKRDFGNMVNHAPSINHSESQSAALLSVEKILTHSLERFGCKAFSARVKVLANGEAVFDSLIHALLSAKQSIDVDFYIYRDDDIGKIITEILVSKAKQGIKVRFVRDGIGALSFPRNELTRLQAAGADCRVFHPVRFPWLTPSLNSRDHGKIVIIDNQEAFIGGINIGNEYTGQDPATGPWRDTELHIVGSSLDSLARVFDINWNQATRQFPEKKVLRQSLLDTNIHFKPNLRNPLPLLQFETAAELTPDLRDRDERTSDEWLQRSEKNGFFEASIQTVFSYPDSGTQNLMEQVYFLCLTLARKSIHLTTPYFGPDRDLTMALIGAALRNVQVRILVPKSPDHKLIGFSSKTYYLELLDAGVQIFLYDKGILHAKTLIIDDDVSIAGATNFDLRSFHLNREVSEVIHSEKIAAKLKRQFENDLLDAYILTREEAVSGSRMSHLIEHGARIFAPFL